METTNHPEPAWILKRSSHDTASKKEEPVQEAVILHSEKKTIIQSLFQRKTA